MTLEAVTSALLLLVAVGFALQMTAVTPLSASTSSQHLENQLQKSSEGVLASTAENGSLQAAVLAWNESEQRFVGADPVGYYRGTPPDNAFGDALRRAYTDRNVAYNVVLHFHTPEGGLDSQVLIDQGDPSDHAVSASWTVPLRDSDTLADGTPLSAAEFYASDIDDDGPMYNMVRVEVVAWRI
ncbi:hypothetical protein GRX03_11435 [Halovenus sp. WSH3]|uniref:Uncharacterized protein n=2 Tax=Halovenus carboxidivorans TaxID=2692199 RepID=A0A6B0TAD7_9EURY|nr:hypothetical protein [Halovenus carboxidivorans]MXR52211.1 hypothetical protein [Halovenus carboxidivorans]